MAHYYLFKLKKNDVVFEFSSQDPKLMYSQLNKWSEELINSGATKINKVAKSVETPKIQQTFVNTIKNDPIVNEPIIIEKIKVVSHSEYEEMQTKTEVTPVILDYPEEFEQAETEQIQQSVKLASLNLDDIDKSTRDEVATPITNRAEEVNIEKDDYDYITFDKIDKNDKFFEVSKEETVKTDNLVNEKINVSDNTLENQEFKLYEPPIVKEYKATDFNSFKSENEIAEEVISEQLVEHSVIKEKFNPSNSNEADSSKDQFFKILQKKFSSISDETNSLEVEEVQAKPLREKIKPSKVADKSIQEIRNYSSTEKSQNISPDIVPGKSLNLKNLDNLIQLKKPNNMFDYLLIAAYYLKESEYHDRYSLKQINAKVFPYTKKPIDHSVIQKAVARNYVEVVPDYTGMAEVTEYVITEEGENYLLNEL